MENVTQSAKTLEVHNYSNTDGGGPSHGHRKHAQKIGWSLNVWFLRYVHVHTRSYDHHNSALWGRSNNSTDGLWQHNHWATQSTLSAWCLAGAQLVGYLYNNMHSTVQRRLCLTGAVNETAQVETAHYHRIVTASLISRLKLSYVVASLPFHFLYSPSGLAAWLPACHGAIICCCSFFFFIPFMFGIGCSAQFAAIEYDDYEVPTMRNAYTAPATDERIRRRHWWQGGAVIHKTGNT